MKIKLLFKEFGSLHGTSISAKLMQDELASEVLAAILAFEQQWNTITYSRLHITLEDDDREMTREIAITKGGDS